jgi:hypothetical protein
VTYRALSLGGGRQSSTLALMAAAGELEPLDVAIFADTHHETAETYAWLDYLEAELDKAGIPLVRCSAGDLLEHHLTAVGRVSQAPLYTVDPETGKLGRIARRCSRDFKVRPVRREARARMRAAGERTLEQWVGISWDESERMSDAGTPAYITTRWPLIERRLTANDCLAWLEAHGYPRPPRSACYFCPQAGPARWRTMRDHHPDEFAKAIAADEALRAHGVPGIDGDVYLSRYGPLATATFGEDDGQGILFEDPDCEGGCFL